MDQDAILDIARQLGEALKESTEYANFIRTRDDMRANASLKEKIDEFKVQKTLLDIEKEKSDADDHVLDIVQSRVETLYKEIMDVPEMKAYSRAEEDLNLLMTAVNMTISSYVGEEEYTAEGEGAACTHDCSHCHADCASHEE